MTQSAPSEAANMADPNLQADLEWEFESRLSESSTLAFRVAVGVLRQREDAEDVAQETLVKAWRSLGRLRAPERLRPWLARIAWRLAVNYRRDDRCRAAREPLGLEVANIETAMEGLVRIERIRLLWRAIDSLPEKLRIVTVLSGVSEHTIPEIALLLELPEGTIKKRLFVARQHMRRFFVDQGLASEIRLGR